MSRIAAPTDRDGHLVELADWNPAIAAELAQAVGIELNEAHWEIIELLRRYHAEREVAPAMRAFVKAVKNALGGAKGNSIYLMGLFPPDPIPDVHAPTTTVPAARSPARIAARIAGLPRPTNCD